MHEVTVKGILSAAHGMNLYRGCTHGCIYCDSRSRCYQINHPFEDIEVKTNAPALLEETLRKKRKKFMIGTGSMCDPYIQLEESLCHTRRCIEIIEQNGFGLSILTKSNRILRDLDLLVKINEKTKCVVQMTMTTYDEELGKIIEPNVSTTKERFEVLKILRDHNINTVVWLCPILPFINDTQDNIRGILEYCIEAKVHGIVCFSMGMTLREGNREYFYEKLDQHFLGLKEQYIQKFGSAYQIVSERNQELMTLFRNICRQNNIIYDVEECFSYIHSFEERESYEQLEFDFNF